MKKEKQKQKEIDHITIYKRVFNSEDGKLILRDLLRSCNFFTGTFNASHAHMAFEEGRRSVVMDLLRTLQLDIEEIKNYYNEIIKEDVNGEF